MTTVGPSKGRFLGNNYTNQNGQCLANIDPNIMLDLLSQAKHLTKVEKSSEIGHQRKSLISAFACF